MKRTAATIGILFFGLIAAAEMASCGGSTLGGGSTGGVPITGIGGNTGRGTGGVGAGAAGGSAPPGIGGFVDPGTAGAIGTGAFGGGIGGGGDPPPCEIPPPPVCGALCGNGRRDSCETATDPACSPAYLFEECDGTDLPAADCQSAGYFSGNLACSATCTLDLSGCQECVPPDALLAACGPAPISNSKIYGFGLGATDSEIGLAFFDDNTTGLTFARLSPTLALTSSARLGALQTGTSQVAVAAIASGWVVAVCSEHEVYIHAVGADGREIARTEVSLNDGPDQSCLSMTLAGRPGGGPLLVWQTPSAVNAAVIAADGLSVGRLQTLAYSVSYYALHVDSAWVGNAFYVGVPIWDDSTNRHTLSLQSVQPDGTITPVRNLLPGDLLDGPSLAAGAADLRAVYPGLPAGGVAPDDLGVIWQRLTLTGQLAALPVEILRDQSYFSISRAVAVGDDTVALVLDTSQGALAVVRLGLDGQLVTPMRDIIKSPIMGVGDMVRRGPELVIGWVSYNSNNGETFLRLARLTP